MVMNWKNIMSYGRNLVSTDYRWDLMSSASSFVFVNSRWDNMLTLEYGLNLVG